MSTSDGYRAKVADVLSWVAIIAALIESRVSTILFTIPQITSFSFEALTSELTWVDPRAAERGFLDKRVPPRPPAAAGRLTLNT